MYFLLNLPLYPHPIACPRPSLLTLTSGMGLRCMMGWPFLIMDRAHWTEDMYFNKKKKGGEILLAMDPFQHQQQVHTSAQASSKCSCRRSGGGGVKIDLPSGTVQAPLSANPWYERHEQVPVPPCLAPPALGVLDDP